MDGIYRSEWIWVVEQRHIKKKKKKKNQVVTVGIRAPGLDPEDQ